MTRDEEKSTLTRAAWLSLIGLPTKTMIRCRWFLFCRCFNASCYTSYAYLWVLYPSSTNSHEAWSQGRERGGEETCRRTWATWIPVWRSASPPRLISCIAAINLPSSCVNVVKTSGLFSMANGFRLSCESESGNLWGDEEVEERRRIGQPTVFPRNLRGLLLGRLRRGEQRSDTGWCVRRRHRNPRQRSQLLSIASLPCNMFRLVNVNLSQCLYSDIQKAKEREREILTLYLP